MHVQCALEGGREGDIPAIGWWGGEGRGRLGGKRRRDAGWRDWLRTWSSLTHQRLEIGVLHWVACVVVCRELGAALERGEEMRLETDDFRSVALTRWLREAPVIRRPATADWGGGKVGVGLYEARWWGEGREIGGMGWVKRRNKLRVEGCQMERLHLLKIWQVLVVGRCGECVTSSE